MKAPVTTPHGPLFLHLLGDGSRWLLLPPLAELAGLSLARHVLARVDGNRPFWRLRLIEHHPCLPLERCPDLFRSLKEEMVLPAHRPALAWLKAHGYQALASFHWPVLEQPLLFEPEPAPVLPEVPTATANVPVPRCPVVAQATAAEGELFSLKDGQAVTTSLAIAQGTEVEHKAVIQLVRTYLEDLQEFGRVTFEMAPFATAGGTQTREIALLNELQATLVMTYMRNSEVVRTFKKRLVKAFYDLTHFTQTLLQARQAQQDAFRHFNVPTTLSKALYLAAEQQGVIERQQATIGAQQAALADHQTALATLAPKAEFADRVGRSQDAVSIRAFAKLLGTGQNRLYQWLRQRDYLIPGRTEPYQQWLDQGLFRLQEIAFQDAHELDRVAQKTLVTGKGQLRLQAQWDADHAKGLPA